jgi:hypothetical protein
MPYFVRYNRVFVVTVIVIIEFDCVTIKLNLNVLTLKTRTVISNYSLDAKQVILKTTSYTRAVAAKLFHSAEHKILVCGPRSRLWETLYYSVSEQF